MIELITLGQLQLRVRGEAPIGIVDQPKRLAVLTYLVAENAAVHQREKLLAMFWPDTHPERARTALRKVLHHTRQVVGDHVLINQGDDAILVDRTGIRCDSTALHIAAANGEDDTVLNLYRGEFLSGFYVDGAPDFNTWIEEERQRLRGESIRSALRLAEALQQSGRDDDACRGLETALALAPFDRKIVTRVVEMLHRAGYSMRAVRVYDELARRMEIELGDRVGALAALREGSMLRSRLVNQLAAEQGDVDAAIRRLT